MSLIYQSQAMRQVLECARRFARTSATVLLQGESGTGKELLASLIHQHSPQHAAPYVRINCAALSESLIESELFGHEAGAFTGATTRRVGRFEEVGAGTVLLDEIGELPLTLQAKLLRVLEEREFQRVGSNETRRFDGRVIAATHRDLTQDIRRGLFREDLYHRLNVLRLPVPPLRQRREDIPALVNHFVKQCQPELEHPVKGVTRDVMSRLCDYSWPGNVRELKNIVLRLCVLAPCEVIDQLQLPEESCAGEEQERRDDGIPAPFDRLTLEEIERKVILFRLQQHSGNKSQVAAALGVTPRTLRNKVGEYRRLGLLP